MPILGKLTINTYSCYNSKLNPLPAGTKIAGSLGTSITNFCSTDNCNTGTATDTATLWCNLGVNGGPFSGLSGLKQSCTGSCGVRNLFFFNYEHLFSVFIFNNLFDKTGTLAGFTGFACIPNCVSGQTKSLDFFGFQANITISNCCNTDYCNTINKIGRQDLFSHSLRTKRSMTQMCDILFQLEQDENEYERLTRLDLCSKILNELKMALYPIF